MTTEDKARTERVSFRASTDVVDALIARAQEDDRSLSYVVRRYVEEGLEREERSARTE